MTIAASLKFWEGDGQSGGQSLLMCADTKFTGAMTLCEPKVFPRQYDSDAKSVIALSGNAAYARMAVRKIESALSKLKNPTLDAMVDAVEAALIKIYKTHVNPHPDRGMVGGPDFWLLLGLWSPKDGLEAYYTNQTAVDTFGLYKCIGSGEYLGDYIIRPRYIGKYADLNRAVFTACTALSRIKTFDADCGGESQFVVLKRTGEISEIETFDISQTEEFSQLFFDQAESLYRTLSDLDLEVNPQLGDSFKNFIEMVMGARERHATDRARRRALFAALAGLGEATQKK